MLNTNNIYILGYSGHSYVTIEVAQANKFNVLGYFDRFESKVNPFNLKYFGYEKDIDLKTIVKNAFVFPAMGSNSIRKKLHTKLIADKINQTVLIDPSAYVSRTASIGESTLVNPNVSINSLSHIGKCCIINTAAVIEHECRIGDFTHVAPGAVLAGNVIVGENCFIGANTVIKQGITISNDVVIGAGAVVLKNITKGTWVGNPAKLITK